MLNYVFCFWQDECKRLRQSIKCGLISTLTVGDVLDKATELQVVRVNDFACYSCLGWEVLLVKRGQFRKGRNRACGWFGFVSVSWGAVQLTYPGGRWYAVRVVLPNKTAQLPYTTLDMESVLQQEKLRLRYEDETANDPFGLGSHEDWARLYRLWFIEECYSVGGGTDRRVIGPGTFYGLVCSAAISSDLLWEFSRRLCPRVGVGRMLNSTRDLTVSTDLTIKKGISFPQEEIILLKNLEVVPEDATTSSFQMHTDNSSWDQGRDPFLQPPIVSEKPTVASTRETPVAPESTPKLRKWNKNGYFPASLKIWRKSDKEDDAIVLNDALEVDVYLANFPSPTPNKGTTGWTGGQAGSHSGPSGNEGLQSPTPNSAHVVGTSVSPLVPGGNKETNSFGSSGFSTFQPHDLSNPVPLAVAPQNIEQGIQYSVQSSQVAPPNNSMTPQMVQSVSGQNPQGWSGAPPQNLQPNLVMNMAGLQQLAYNQWGGVPNMVQNTNLVGNMQQPNMPQEQWGQFPFPVTQPNMQQPQQAQPQLQPLPPQPTQSNVNWGAMVPTPNMGWVAPNTGIPMNVQAAWGPMVQAQQVTGTVDPTWAMQAGSVGTVPGNVQAGWVPQPAVPGAVTTQSWVPTPVQGNPGWVGPPGTQVAPNAGWVGTPTVNQGPAAINTGGWVGPPGTQAAPVANQGWVPPAGKQGTPPPPGGNNSQKWGSPSPRGRGNWGGNDRGNFSGQRRNYNRDSSYRGGGGNRQNFNRQDSFHNNSESNHNDGGSYRNEGMSYYNEGRSHNKDGSFRGGSGDQPARSSDE
ncbi:zinc finger CCCH domain-containing protein 19-like protein [Tanacetum coccineum]